MEVANKKVLVVGLGKSGFSAARWLSGQGAKVTVSELKPETDLQEDLLKKTVALGVELEVGGHRKETFLRSDMVVVSPGVPLDIEPLKAAMDKGIPVIGELELACRLVDAPVVAVTGTNGKSTTASLLGSLIERAGWSVFVGGNIGRPLMDYVVENLKAQYLVVEVSSFQLDTMKNLSPLISLLLNVSPDHLDRYPSYDAYVQSKLHIFENQGPGQYAILNDDDEKLSGFEPSGKVSVLRYGLEERENRHAFVEHKTLWAHLPGVEGYSFELDRFSLPGRHNLQNLMGVVLAGLALRIDPSIMQESINQFQGLPDRIEWVGTLGGVDFYNDSKATNVEAAISSIESFERPLILIAGGRHKGGDYTPLVKAAKKRVKKAILLGEARHLLADALGGVIPFVLAQDMKGAVSQAFSSSEPGDVILLAPACSSFDMFSDYHHRGKIFRQEVERLHYEGEKPRVSRV